ncbi:MAG: class I SAM-dependent methyltransferase [Oscillospiraceae bacterium]|nr:class I SAM-dependent methyltransferase [Oscillospiraceae bacterium]
MNYYQNIIKKIEDNKHLISWVPVDELVRFGYEAGLNEKSKVLDLCCGFGTVLKVWSEAFGISGIGVNLGEDIISIGKERLKRAGVEKISLICEDVTNYNDDEKYDVVICSETINSIQNTFVLGEKFLKKYGILAYQKVYSKIPNPPQELLDFEGEVLPLSELNDIFNSLGYYLKFMASETDNMFENYVANWNAKQDLDKLRDNLNDENSKRRIDKWWRMYFDYRRPYQGQALFGLEKFE